MKKLLRKFANWLYLRFGTIDIAAMTRLQIQGNIERTKFENLHPNEKQRIFSESKLLQKNEVLQQIIDEIVHEQEQHIIYHANTESVVFADRFSINGATLIRERIQKYASWSPAQEKVPNPFAIID